MTEPITTEGDTPSTAWSSGSLATTSSARSF